MPLGIDFLMAFGIFWCQNGAKLAPTWDRKSMLTSKGDFQKSLFFQWKNKFCLDPVGRSWEQKSIKNSSPRWNASWHRFGRNFWVLGAQLGWKICQKSIPGNQNRFQGLPNAARSSQKQPEAREIDFWSFFKSPEGGDSEGRDGGGFIDNFQRLNHKPSTRTRVLSSGHETHGRSATPSRTSAVADYENETSQL